MIINGCYILYGPNIGENVVKDLTGCELVLAEIQWTMLSVLNGSQCFQHVKLLIQQLLRSHLYYALVFCYEFPRTQQCYWGAEIIWMTFIIVKTEVFQVTPIAPEPRTSNPVLILSLLSAYNFRKCIETLPSLLYFSAFAPPFFSLASLRPLYCH